VTSSSDVGDARLRVETVAAGSAARVIIEGEADVGSVTHLETALESIDLDGAETVELHVSDLTFIDVAALRRLTRFADGLKRGGRHVITHGARPTLRRMALELGVQEELGLP
jgi:anti-anti-sigma regulatory factor